MSNYILHLPCYLYDQRRRNQILEGPTFESSQEICRSHSRLEISVQQAIQKDCSFEGFELAKTGHCEKFEGMHGAE